MGLKLFSNSCFSGYTPQSAIEPNPRNFRIREVYSIQNHVVAVVHYPNAINFEGKKILVFKDMTEQQFRKIEVLDPHFFDNDVSPFARFKPTKEGLEAAKALCKTI